MIRPPERLVPRRHGTLIVLDAAAPSHAGARHDLDAALAPMRIGASMRPTRPKDGPCEEVAHLMGDDRLAAATAAVADGCGAVVEEAADGWTAVEPLTQSWGSVPGACRIWDARRLADGRFELRLVQARTRGELLLAQGWRGWEVEWFRSGNGRWIEVAYTHPETALPRAEGSPVEARRRP